MTTLEILRQARALIEDEKHWGTGNMCSVTGQLCAAGAVLMVTYGDAYAYRGKSTSANTLYAEADKLEPMRLLAKAVAENDPEGWDRVEVSQVATSIVTGYNDSHPMGLNFEETRANRLKHHGVVLALFDRAIEMASEDITEPIEEKAEKVLTHA